MAIDGGTTNSVMRYNYSHDNDGAGYLPAQCPNARPFAGNVVRYNVSENDGRKNGYAAIHVWGHVRDTEIHNNTVYVSPAASGAPRGVFFDASEEALAYGLAATSSGVRVCNNIFQTAGGVTLVEAEGEHPGLLFRGNAYFPDAAAFRVVWGGADFGSLAGWRVATGQETDGARETGTSADPQLLAPGGGGTLGDAAQLGALDAYRLRDSSPLIEAGLDLSRLFGVDQGAEDYFGNPLPQRAAYDVGAHEAEAPPGAASEKSSRPRPAAAGRATSWRGGLHRSTDGGANRVRLMDGAQSLSIGAIAVDPVTPSTVFVGTGEGSVSANSFFGVGLYIIRNAETAPVLTGPFNLGGSGADVFKNRTYRYRAGAFTAGNSAYSNTTAAATTTRR